MKPEYIRRNHGGFTMIEVLISLVILLLGLLGLAGLQTRSQQAETESYQRVQALVLVRDMADRINANRALAANYVTGVTSTTAMGTASTKDCSAPATTADTDLCQWDAALKGAAESSGGSSVGAMIAARGCITSPATNQYLIQVVWQGLTKTVAPPSTVNCASGTTYGTDDLRRAVTTVVQIGTLTP